MRTRFDFAAFRPTLVFIGLTCALASCGSSGAGPSTGTTVESIALTPGTDSLVPQQTLPLSATAKDADGNAISGAAISWSVTPASVATISNTGEVTGNAPGTATVTALSDGKSATAAITVLNGAMVGAAGATITGPDGTATLVIPAGALATATPISVEPMVTPPGAAGLIRATATDFGPTGTQFAQPVTVKLHYDPTQLPSDVDPSQLQLYLRNGLTYTVVPGSAVDTATHTITGTVTHFSGYVACEQTCLGSTPTIYLDAFDSTSAAPGGSVTVSSEAGLIADTGPITLTVGGLPAGITASLSTPQRTNDPSGGFYESFSVTLNVASTVPLGHYVVGVNATGDETFLNVTAPITLLVTHPGLVVSPSPASLTIMQGATGTSTIALQRTAVPGSVALTAEGVPAGVTATFNPASTTGNASVLSLAASASATPGTYSVTVRARTAGLSDVTTSVGLSVFPLSGFGLNGTPAFVNVPQGGSASTGVQVTRAPGFTGTVSYSVSGQPSGLTVTTAPTTVTDSEAVNFTASASVAPGNYPITVTGSSNGKTTQTVITATVVTGSAGVTVHLDYSACNPAVQPIWVAYQDGAGAFTQATGSGGVFSFNLTQGKGMVVVVTPFLNGPGHETTILFGTPSELPSLTACGSPPAPPLFESLAFTVGGLLPGDDAIVSTPLSTVFAETAVPSGTLRSLATGTTDVTAFRYNVANPALDVRGLIDRGINLPNGGDIGTLDFAGPQSFTPVSGTLTLQNVNDEPINWIESYLTQPQGCSSGNEFMESQTAAGTTVYGIPAALQQPNDLHVFNAYTTTRAVIQYMHAFSSPTLRLGAALDPPSFSELPGAFKRPQVTVTLSSDYQFVSYSWDNGNASGLSMVASTGYFGSNFMPMATPDLSTLPGYDLSWAPAPVTGNYSLAATSSATTNCVDGGVVRQARVGGTN